MYDKNYMSIAVAVLMRKFIARNNFCAMLKRPDPHSAADHSATISVNNVNINTIHMKNKFFSLLVIAILTLGNQVCKSQNTQTDDPYLWLEEVESEKSLEWVKAKNAISERVLTTNTLFETLRSKYVKEFNDKDKLIYPEMVGEFVYNLWQDEKNERGLWRRMSKTDFLNKKTNWESVIDLDELSKKESKKWVLQKAEWLAPDNKICLVYLSDGGKDENEIREFNAETKEFVKGGFLFKESKGGASWIDNNNVLVYRNFGEGTLTTSGYSRKVKLLKRGTSLENAKVIFETDTSSVEAAGYSIFSMNKQHVFVSNAKTFYDTELYYLSGEKLEKIDYPRDAVIIGFHKNEIILSLQSDWIVSEKNYKAGSLVSFDLNKNIKRNLDIKTIYEPNAKSSFVSMSTSKDFVTINIMENVQNKLISYKLENNKWISKVVEAPQFGSIWLIASTNQSNDYFFTYSNFITPPTLYHANETKIELTKKMKDVFNSGNLEVQQNTAISKDGTSIPYFFVHKKGIALNGTNPTIIDAYGGFNVSVQPDYTMTVGIGWLEQGGVYVLANIRGGGEFGPSWHQAAMKEKRQNAYDDFFAVSQDLIDKKITSPKYLGAFGWSNGGLLMGVVFTQRPDLYNAVVVGAPLLDMRRYSKLLAGASWMGEYGDPDIPEEWEYIKKYSPYHNISKNKKYPEVFFVTSTKDDRVHPGHARKMAAKMIDMGHPLVYHETIEGGHGAASTNEQMAYMFAEIYSYFNMKLKKNPLNFKLAIFN